MGLLPDMRKTWSIIMMLAVLAGLGGCSTVSGRTSNPFASIPALAEPAEAQLYGDFLAARYANLNHDPAAAAVRYASRVDSLPDDMTTIELAVTSFLSAGDFNAAARMAVMARHSQFEDAPLARLTAAVDAFRNLRFEETHALLADTEPAPFLDLLENGLDAWALAALGRRNEALDVLQVMQGQGAMLSGLTKYHQAFVFLHSGDDEAAMALFDSAWADGVRLPIAVDAHARLAASQGDIRKAKALIGGFYADLGDNPLIDALYDELSAGRAIQPPRPGPGKGAAIALLAPTAALVRQTRTDVAVSYLQLVIALDPTQHSARILAADALERTGRLDDAVALLDAVPANSVFAAAVEARKAWLLKDMEQTSAAFAAAERSLASNPGRSIRVQVGDLYRSLERYDLAEAIFDKVVNEDRAAGVEDWRVIFARGAARERLGDWPAAEQDLSKALELSPNRPEILNYLGYYWVDRGANIDDAFDLIRAAVAQRPNSGFIVDSLGWAYYRIGHYAEAVVQLERAASLDPNDPTINDHLGDAYWRMGRHDLARYQWRRVLDFDPPPALLENVQGKLDRGLPVADKQNAH